MSCLFLGRSDRWTCTVAITLFDDLLASKSVELKCENHAHSVRTVVVNQLQLDSAAILMLSLVGALFWAQVLSWWAQWPDHRDTYLLEFVPWEHVDLTVNIDAETGHHRAILINPFTHRSTFCHSPNFKMKTSPCSAHWAYQHETWAQKRAHIKFNNSSPWTTVRVHVCSSKVPCRLILNAKLYA